MNIKQLNKSLWQKKTKTPKKKENLRQETVTTSDDNMIKELSVTVNFNWWLL